MSNAPLSKLAPKDKSSPPLVPQLLPSLSEGGSLIQNYMAKVSRIPVLSRDSEYQLAVDYFENKSPSAGKILIQSNLRFVVKIAAEYSKFNSRLMDLIQEGNLGLIRAVKEFNPYKGARLITYAVWWIRGCIQEYLIKQHSIVRIGMGKKQKKLFYLLQREKQKLEEYPSSRLLPVLAEQTQTDVQDIEKMKELILKKDLSLDRPIGTALGTEKGGSFLDLQADPSSPLDESLSQKQVVAVVRKVLQGMEKNLNEREKHIIQHRLLEDPPKTLQEIADEFSLTREAVRQNEARVLKKLKKQLLPYFKKPY